MQHTDHGTIAQEAAKEAIRYVFCGHAVECRERIVEEDHGGKGVASARKADTLPLTAGQPDAVIAHE